MRMQTLWKMVFTGLIISIAASGATLTRPYGPSDYAGGAKAVGTKINSEFANIVSWLNGQNISSSNIVSFGVAETNLAPNSVTTTKIFPGSIDSDRLASNSVTTAKILDQSVTNNKILDGTISRAKLIPLATSLSAATTNSTFNNTSSSSPTAITQLSTTITTGNAGAGRPVIIALVPDQSATSNSAVQLIDSSAQSSSNITSAPSVVLYLFRDGLQIGSYFLKYNVGRATTQASTDMVFPTAGIQFVDTAPPAGSHTYDVRAGNMNSSTVYFGIYNSRLFVREI